MARWDRQDATVAGTRPAPVAVAASRLRRAHLDPVRTCRDPERFTVPQVLLDSTTKAAGAFISRAARAFVSSHVLAITEGVLKTMLINQVRLTTITALTLMALGAGVLVFGRTKQRGAAS